MGPAALALIPAIASVAGAGLGALGQHDANKTNVRLAREQMDFQRQMAHSAEAFSERMANTQVQRRVADLRAAGLNVGLAYEGTAAAPAGVTAGGSQGRVENTARDLPNVAATALSLKQMLENIKLTKAQNYKTMHEADLALEQKLEVQRQRIWNKDQEPAMTRRNILQNLFMELDVPGKQNAADLEKRLKDLGGSTTARLFLDFVRGISGIRR